ncbi:Protein of unknown function [Bacillus wiedmannii]|jgi:hypothetical protein
MPKK